MKSADTIILIFAFLWLSVPAAFGCQFQYDPASAPQYYRANGWSLPGIKASVLLSGGRITEESIPGAVAEGIAHESPYVVDFPARDFLLNGTRNRMRTVRVQVSIWRWTMHGRAVAYTYSLTPVAAHREDGRWSIDAMAACIYYATFIDDKGDGIFRVMVPDRFTAALVPRWAKSDRN